MSKLNEDQKLVLEILNKCEYDNDKIVTNFKSLIAEEIKDQKRQISAFQFGSYISKEVEKFGKEAMQVEILFSEEEVLLDNIELIKKLTNCSNLKIIPFNEETKPKSMKNSPLLGKPVFICEN